MIRCTRDENKRELSEITEIVHSWVVKGWDFVSCCWLSHVYSFATAYLMLLNSLITGERDSTGRGSSAVLLHRYSLSKPSIFLTVHLYFVFFIQCPTLFWVRFISAFFLLILQRKLKSNFFCKIFYKLHKSITIKRGKCRDYPSFPITVYIHLV